MYRYENNINIQWKTDKHWGNEIYFIEQTIKPDVLIHCLIHVFVTYRLNQAIEKVIKEEYYFSNDEEVMRIVELTNWLTFELNIDCHTYEQPLNMKHVLFELFKSNLKEKQTIHFDSVINFRMQSFKQYLTHVVGLAIDEFKREEEHQNFIHSVREYINKRKTQHEEIHLVQNDPFLFYNKDGKQYTTRELKALIYKEPLYIVGLDENEQNLAPLIALLPEKIFIYGDDPAHVMTLSIINIFQEKVRFYPYEKFPFKHQKDKS